MGTQMIVNLDGSGLSCCLNPNFWGNSESTYLSQEESEICLFCIVACSRPEEVRRRDF